MTRSYKAARKARRRADRNNAPKHMRISPTRATQGLLYGNDIYESVEIVTSRFFQAYKKTQEAGVSKLVAFELARMSICVPDPVSEVFAKHPVPENPQQMADMCSEIYIEMDKFLTKLVEERAEQ